MLPMLLCGYIMLTSGYAFQLLNLRIKISINKFLVKSHLISNYIIYHKPLLIPNYIIYPSIPQLIS